MHRHKALVLILVIAFAWCPQLFADEDNRHASDGNLSAALFIGKSVRGFQSYPLESTDGDQRFIGVSGAWMPLDAPLGFRIGMDGGVLLRDDGNRYGPSGTSGEVWVGPTIRHKGLEIGPVILKPALTVGLSAVTNSYGLERQRELEEDGDAALLYYYGPELAISTTYYPNIDLVYRLHHRSGAGEVSQLPTLGSIGDTMNANMIGIRLHF